MYAGKSAAKLKEEQLKKKKVLVNAKIEENATIVPV